MKKTIIAILLLLTIVLHASAVTVKQFKSDKLTSNIVTCIVQDKKGYIWIGTEHGLNKFDGYRCSNYLHSDKDSTSITHNTIVTLFVDSRGNLLIGTNGGLCRYDYDNNDFVTYPTPGGEKPRVSAITELRDGEVLAGTQGYGMYGVDFHGRRLTSVASPFQDGKISYCTLLHTDRDGNLWQVGNDNVVICYPKGKPRSKCRRMFVSAFGNPVRFLSDRNGRMVIVCQHGLLTCDKQLRQLVPYLSSQKQPLNNLFFSTSYIDRAGNMFLGTIGTGVFFIPRTASGLQRYNISNIDFSLNSADVRFVFTDNKDNLWIGCNNKGLLLVPNLQTKFNSWSFASQNYQVGNAIRSMTSGDNGGLWCTIANGGTYLFDRNGKICAHAKTPVGTDIMYRDRKGNYWLGAYDILYSFSPAIGICKQVAKLPGNTMFAITDDGKGKLYISSYSKGLTVYDCATHTTKNFSMYHKNGRKGGLCNDWINAMFFDSKGLLWLGTTAGISCFSPRTESFTTYGDKVILPQISGSTFCEDRDGNIVIGTNKGLFIFNRKSRSVMPFPGAEELANQNICSSLTTRSGDIWLSTTMGIWQYQHRTRKFQSYINGDGLNAREYIANVGVQDADGRISVATSEGVTSFYPDQITAAHGHVDSPILTNVLIGGKPVDCSTRSDGEVITDRPVDDTNHFKVSYLDNTFTMEFSTLDYGHADNTVFEYRLNSSEKWMPTDDNRNAILFSHLQPGLYTVQVRARIGEDCSAISTYYITVTPPWYRSAYAYVLYIVIFLALAGYVFFVYIRRRREAVYEEKMQFLMNATHDIRSPLTLIMGPLKKMMAREYDSETKGCLETINHNAQRILKLVNQILDIRKFDKNQMALRYQDTNLVAYVRNLCRNFDFLAKDYGVKFSFVADQDVIHAWIDRINFDKVVSNLLSNAFKYVRDEGEVTVRVSVGHDDNVKGALSDYVQIQVLDNGIGLGQNNVMKIFDRFYQGANSVNIGTQGTGIGLNLCKMIVGLHHGSITAANRTDSTGSCFTVRIPQGKAHLNPEEMVDDEAQKADDDNIVRTRGTQNMRVLVVDDDPEICRYISEELSVYYRFTLCSNGKEALDELLRDGGYDAVISDVSMPVMDGLELVKAIKHNPGICQLPVVLLTSKSDIADKLGGLSVGADAYIAKPFDLEELRVTVKGLISNVRILRGKFSGTMKQEERVAEKKVDGNNDMLMERVMRYVNDNISDSDFSVEQLASMIGMSRAHLHRKMKEITGISTSDFLRNQRMQQATKLLLDGNINITQVAYSVGYTSEAHFSTVFKKQFGMTPTEYQKKNEKG